MVEQKKQSLEPLGFVAIAAAFFSYSALYLGKVTVDSFPLLSCWLLGTAVLSAAAGLDDTKYEHSPNRIIFLLFAALFMFVGVFGFAIKYALMKAGLPYDGRIEGYGWMAMAIFLTIITPVYVRFPLLQFLMLIFADIAIWCLVGVNLQVSSKEFFAPIIGWTMMIAGVISIYIAGGTVFNESMSKVVLPMPAPLRKA